MKKKTSKRDDKYGKTTSVRVDPALWRLVKREVADLSEKENREVTISEIVQAALTLLFRQQNRDLRELLPPEPSVSEAAIAFDRFLSDPDKDAVDKGFAEYARMKVMQWKADRDNR